MCVCVHVSECVQSAMAATVGEVETHKMVLNGRHLRIQSSAHNSNDYDDDDDDQDANLVGI